MGLGSRKDRKFICSRNTANPRTLQPLSAELKKDTQLQGHTHTDHTIYEFFQLKQNANQCRGFPFTIIAFRNVMQHKLMQHNFQKFGGSQLFWALCAACLVRYIHISFQDMQSLWSHHWELWFPSLFNLCFPVNHCEPECVSMSLCLGFDICAQAPHPTPLSHHTPSPSSCFPLYGLGMLILEMR